MESKRMNKVQPMIEDILTRFPKSRNNDLMLYCYYLNELGYSKHTSFWEICQKVWNKEFCSIETIGRARRKIQEKNSNLGPSEAAKIAKKKAEKEFVEYSKT